MNRWAANADAGRPALFTAAPEPEPQPSGIAPELLERCMRRGAAKKKGEQPAGGSADNLVLSQLEAQKARERCVRAVIAQHRKAQKAPAKK